MQQHASSNAAVFVTKAQASFTELLDQREAILLDLENLHYYTLNATAIFLWKQLRTHAAQTAVALTRELTAAFQLNLEQAELDVLMFLDELRNHGLIEAGQSAPLQNHPDLAVERAALPAYEAPQLKLANSLAQVVLSGSSTIATAAIATG
jgi:hypothetical protein